jgi:hypothetical protein
MVQLSKFGAFLERNNRKRAGGNEGGEPMVQATVWVTGWETGVGVG